MSYLPCQKTVMDQTAMNTTDPPLPPPSHDPAPPTATADNLGRTQLSPWALQELEHTIHDMDPAYRGLAVSTTKKYEGRYILNVRGEGAHHCLNKGSAHRRSNIYFVVDRSGVCQKCRRKGGDGSCASFRSQPAAIAPELQNALFGSASGTSQRPRALTAAELAGPLLRSESQSSSPTHGVAAAAAITQPSEASSSCPLGEDSPASKPSVTRKPRRKRPSSGPDGGPEPKVKKSKALGANSLPIVLACVKYSIDVVSLQQYAATPEAAAVVKQRVSASEACVPMTDREMIDRFLKHVQRSASGDGLCNVSYTRSEIGQALVDAGFIQHARLYPDQWPSCATQLGKKMRGFALGKFYAEMDDKDAFHRLLQRLTQNAEARAIIERIITDDALKPTLSQHYFGNMDRVSDIKTLLHSLSNGGGPEAWRRKCGASRHEDPPFVKDLQRVMAEVTEELATTGVGPEAVRYIAEHFPTKYELVSDPRPGEPDHMKRVKVRRDPALTWKSYILQHHEFLGLQAKISVAAHFGISRGPPLHDCLFVEKVGGSRLESLGLAMSDAVLEASGVRVDVRHKEVTPYAADERGGAFCLFFNSAKFDEKEFVPNSEFTEQEDIDRSLAEYNRWLSRFFVCIVGDKNPMVVQVFYYPDSDRVQNVICRNPDDTKNTFLEMKINVEASTNPHKPPSTAPLLHWYLRLNNARRTAAHVNMWTSPEDIEKHPEDLNVFGGLEFDSRFARDNPSPRTEPLKDPFPVGPLPRAAAGLKPTHTQPSLTDSDAEWRSLEGLKFILYHLKFVLCGGDKCAFEYLIQWFGYIFQTRRKPGVMPQFLSEEGVGKSAIFGKNESGLGLLARIYGQYFQWSDDIDSLLGRFNGDSMHRLFCVMEEAGTYRKGHRDWNRMKSMITEGTMNVEMKNVNRIEINDNRAFVMLTNNRDSLKVEPGSRRFLCCEANSELSQKAVDSGHCTKETRREYMAKLDRTKNSDDVAYAFFSYCMRLDLKSFHLKEPARTDLFLEQRAHNECALKCLLQDAQSGAYPVKRDEFSVLTGEQKFTAVELFGVLRRYVAETGACTTIDSAMSLGHVLTKKYYALAPKVEGRVAKYKLVLPEAQRA